MPDNRPPERRLVIGFPEFWPEVERAYPRFFELSQNVMTALHSVTDREYAEPESHQRAILNLSMLAGVTMVEIVTLVANGLGHGAMKCLRALLETSINTEYLRLRPAEFEDYREWYWVERFKEQEFLREHAREFYQQINPNTIGEVQQNMTRVRPRFERVRPGGNRGELRRSWCSLNLADRSVVTGHQESYRLINPTASSFIHSTMYGLMRHYDAGRDIHRIDVPPSLEWSAQALSSAHHCMVRVVRTVGQTFDVQPDPPPDQLERDWQEVWANNERNG
jgi:hypothetical protein